MGNVLDNLDPVFREMVDIWLSLLKARGVNILITSGYRNYKDQDYLYSQGRTRTGVIVTNARGGYSAHNFGLAIDFVPLIDGKPTYDIPKMKEYAQLAKNLGMSWGGDWLLFYDAPHLEYTQGQPLSYFRNGGRLVRDQIMAPNPLEILKRLQGRLERTVNSESRGILSRTIDRLKNRIS